MRDIETIDAELRLLSRAWRVAREVCDRMPSTAHIDELLDERSATMTVARSPATRSNENARAPQCQYHCQLAHVHSRGLGEEFGMLPQ